MPAEKSTGPPRRPGFNGRRWICDALARAMEAPSGTWVLVGEPGIGKSALLRDLAEEHPGSPFLEIRRPLGTHRPEEFWTSLLQQFDLEGQRPPRSPHEAARWVQAHLPPGNNRRRLVLVDALERAPGLVDSSGFAGLDTPPPGVWLVIASRPGAHLHGVVRGGAREFLLRPEDPRNMADLLAYLEQALEGRPGEWAEAVARHSAGNFLVARHLMEALCSGELNLHGLSANPVSLQKAFAALWDEVIDLTPAGLQDDLVRVACVLCEAGEALPESSMADFLGLSAHRVHQVVRRLLPLLRQEDNCFTLFNRRMARFLATRFRRDLVEVHRRIISFFREAYPSWEEMDDRYGWFYLGHHCDRYARTSRRRDFSVLHWLGEGPYVRAKLETTRSLQAVLDDLRRCLRAACEERDLPRIVSYALRIPRLRGREAARGLHRLADEGRFHLARERARLMRRESSRFRGFLLLAWQAHHEGSHDLAGDLLGEALAVPRPLLGEDDVPLFLCIAGDLATAHRDRALDLLAHTGDPYLGVSCALRWAEDPDLPPELQLQVLEKGASLAAAIEEEGEKGAMMARLARAFRDRGEHQRARQLGGRESPERQPLEEELGGLAEAEDPHAAFRQILEKASRLPWDPHRAQAFNAVADRLLALEEADWLPEALTQLTQAVVQLKVAHARLTCLQHLTRRLAALGRQRWTEEAFERLAGVAETLEDLAMRSRALGEIALAQHRCRQLTASRQRFSVAASLAFQVEVPPVRAGALLALAGCVARSGDVRRALDLAFHSLEAAEEPAAERVDRETRSALAVGVAGAIPRDHSLELFQKSAAAAREMPDLRLRANLLGALAHGLFRLGQEEWAGRLLDQALGAARAMEPGFQQASTLASLATQVAACGDPIRAEKVVAEAADAARIESTPSRRAAGFLAVAEGWKAVADEAASRQALDQALEDLAGCPPEQLTSVEALTHAAHIVSEAGQVERVTRLLHRARKGAGELSRPKGDEILLMLVKAHLALGQAEEARKLAESLSGVELRSRAQVELARALIRRQPEEALSRLKEVPLFDDRMRGVRECTVELLRDLLPSRRDSVLELLTELTLVATEDEETADVLASRWVLLIAEPGAIGETLRKMGWPVEELAAGRVPAPAET